MYKKESQVTIFSEETNVHIKQNGLNFHAYFYNVIGFFKES